MSSDESAWEGEGTRRRRLYYVKRRKCQWRSPEAQKRLEIVDAYMNTTNAFGRAGCGNAPRERIRSTAGPISVRDPVTGCPRNTYNNEFDAGLTNAEHRSLKIAAAMDLGHDPYQGVPVSSDSDHQ